VWLETKPRGTQQGSCSHFVTTRRLVHTLPTKPGKGRRGLEEGAPRRRSCRHGDPRGYVNSVHAQDAQVCLRIHLLSSPSNLFISRRLFLGPYASSRAFSAPLVPSVPRLIAGESSRELNQTVRWRTAVMTCARPRARQTFLTMAGLRAARGPESPPQCGSLTHLTSECRKDLVATKYNGSSSASFIVFIVQAVLGTARRYRADLQYY